MNATVRKTERLHVLDCLRAIMMLLGVVIYTALTYAVTDFGAAWSLKDLSSTNMGFDLLTFFTHSFRLQVFFVVTSFFGAFLFYERGCQGMVNNRIDRIVLPFIAFVLILWPFIAFTWLYTGFALSQTVNVFAETMKIVGTPLIFVPQNTFHFWFLYYLAMISASSIGIAFLLKKLLSLTSRISQAFGWIIQRPMLRVLFFTALSCIVYLFMGESKVKTSNSFVTDFDTFLYYFLFFNFGWILYKSKHLLASFKRLDWLNVILGIILAVAYFLNYDKVKDQGELVLRSFFTWLFIFGFTGLFLRYGSKHSARRRYVSDASYWVYLVHLPLTGIIIRLIASWDLYPPIKFLTVVAGSAIFCLVTYHYFVRSTFIGKFVDCRKYSLKLSDIKNNEDVWLKQRAFT